MRDTYKKIFDHFDQIRAQDLVKKHPYVSTLALFGIFGYTAYIAYRGDYLKFIGLEYKPKNLMTAIINAKIFDGKNLIEHTTLVINGEYIHAVGGPVPTGATVIDAHGATLMPGFIDSHVHTDFDGLKDALHFGVTTELEMMGGWSRKERREIANRTDIADVRSAEMGITTPGGHPTQYIKMSENLLLRYYFYFFSFPSVSNHDEAVRFVAKQVAKGADYIKILLEDGDTVGFPGLPVLDDETLMVAVREAHRYNKMAVAHVTSFKQAQRAIRAGVDGLAHMFFDSKPTPDFVREIAESGAFVIPTLVTISSAFGHRADALAADKRVSARLSQKWLHSLSQSINVYPQGKIDDVLASVLMLHQAGVEILAGSDVSEPIPGLGGLAHGASLHHELQFLVSAGLTPVEALRSTTSIPARRFGFFDRGRIAPGTRADLLLVDGDPLNNISDTLSINTVWRGGKPLATNELQKKLRK